MILILTERNDKSVFRVCEWLDYLNTEYTLIFDEDTLEIVSLKVSDGGVNFIYKVREEIVDYDFITAVWWRRTDFFLKKIIDPSQDDIIRSIKLMEIDEFQSYNTFIHYLFSLKPSIGNRLRYPVNKLQALVVANKNGIKIPTTSICYNKKQLEERMKNYTIITKPVKDFLPYELNGQFNILYTQPINADVLANIPEQFNYSMIQNCIEKDFEIRVFVFGEMIFSMAIHSQFSPSTKHDFRTYEEWVPYTPYEISKNTKKKILSFMKDMNLETGSLDFIVSKNEEIVFLEVNPVGIFDMVSVPCNYNIEKQIAEYLIKIQHFNNSNKCVMS